MKSTQKRFFFAYICTMFFMGVSSYAQGDRSSGDVTIGYSDEYSGSGYITQGPATLTHTLDPSCGNVRKRTSAVGTISDTKGNVWTVPSQTLFSDGLYAPDLYNECSGVTYNSIQEVDIDRIPIVEIDKGGEVITGYIFADNYFELYVNGTLVGIDPVPFTPFNANIVRFRASYPITYAVKLVDWEENLGLGSEANRGSSYHPGDGGFVASFSDGTITDASWKAQTFYIAPVEDLSTIQEAKNGSRISSKNTLSPSCDTQCYAVHYELPSDWYAPSFDDSTWPYATTYSNDTVGVDNKKAYTNFEEVFIGADAVFIWSTNLVLDNEVVVRYTAQKK